MKKKRQNLKSANALDLRDVSMKCLETDYFLKNPVLDARGKPGHPEMICESKYELETKCAYGARTVDRTRAHWCIASTIFHIKP